MTPKTKYILGVASAAIVILSATPRLAQSGENHVIPLAQDVRTITLRGAGTALKLETSDTKTINLETEDSFGCTLKADIEQKGDVLEINVVKGGFRIGFWCDPDVIVAIPDNLGLDIGLENLAADISGKFADVKIRSGQSVINFEGSATHFAMTGDRAAVRLNFSAEMPRDAVKIDVGTLLSDINFAAS